jgi:hypothetical protein
MWRLTKRKRETATYTPHTTSNAHTKAPNQHRNPQHHNHQRKPNQTPNATRIPMRHLQGDRHSPGPPPTTWRQHWACSLLPHPARTPWAPCPHRAHPAQAPLRAGSRAPVQVQGARALGRAYARAGRGQRQPDRTQITTSEFPAKTPPPSGDRLCDSRLVWNAPSVPVRARNGNRLLACQTAPSTRIQCVLVAAGRLSR